MKLCPSCGTEKALNLFYKAKGRKDGYKTDCKACESKKTADRSLEKLYGITRDDYNQMFAAQKGCCKICHRHQSQFKKRLNVDHCHSTGKVRGLLCHSCNLILGHSLDDISTLQRAIEYLRAAAQE